MMHFQSGLTLLPLHPNLMPLKWEKNGFRKLVNYCFSWFFFNVCISDQCYWWMSPKNYLIKLADACLTIAYSLTRSEKYSVIYFSLFFCCCCIYFWTTPDFASRDHLLVPTLTFFPCLGGKIHYKILKGV